jgi:MYXO-CTERM domain-containing protein
LACGGPFGAGVEVDPAQTIVVSHQDGVEHYEFNPSFCGKGAEFGLILPVPSPLEGKAVLGAVTLRDELEDLSKPTVVKDEVRYCDTGNGPPPGGGFDGGGGGGKSGGVDVIDGGTVGFLDYELLKADSEKSLTDFLDANKYPYDDKSKAAFTHYVSKGWYFVAFKVAAGDAPPQGKRLCGDLGPIALSFKTAEPVIPTRILFDDRSYLWRVYTLAAENRGPQLADIYSGQLQFAGAVTEADLAARPGLATIAKAGTRVTRHDIGFFGASVVDDLTLAVTSTPTADYRAEQHEVTYIADSTMCAGSGGASGKAGSAGKGASSTGTAGTSASTGGTTASTGGATAAAGSTGAAVSPAATPASDDGCALSPGNDRHAWQGALAAVGVALAGLVARRRRRG